ncbi:hypothetical protein B484DRAFT_433274 [Ochromonadaceae sp. CCMP2298]|nr:hypothetical protein B484DRAFT_433274 [Ochromonadaceae sp. CCMP2298]
MAGHTACEEVERKIEYYLVDPYTALLNQLRTFRDSWACKPLGVDLGSLGECIAVVLQADHGGGSMKFIEVILARAGDKQTITADLARYEGKQTHHILEQTMMPVIDNGFSKMKDRVLVVLEWAGGFDFVDVPAEAKEHPEQLKVRRLAGGGMRARWDGGYRDFETTIPDDYTWKILLIEPFLSMDLAAQFIYQGRPNHAGSNCPICKALRTQWLKGHCDGMPHWTLPDMCAEVTQWINVNGQAAGNEGDGSGDKDDDAEPADADATTAGFTSMMPLVRSIPLPRWIVPTLHIRLGLGWKLLLHVDEYIIEKVERQSPAVASAQAGRDQAIALLAQLTAARDQLKSTPKAQWLPNHTANVKAQTREVQAASKAKAASIEALKKARKRAMMLFEVQQDLGEFLGTQSSREPFECGGDGAAEAGQNGFAHLLEGLRNVVGSLHGVLVDLDCRRVGVAGKCGWFRR